MKRSDAVLIGLAVLGIVVAAVWKLTVYSAAEVSLPPTVHSAAEVPLPPLPQPVVVRAPSAPVVPARPRVGTTCPADVATVGVPVASMGQSDPAYNAAASSQGCTIALWDYHSTSIEVSWDAGQTFSTVAIDGTWNLVAVADGRVVVARHDNTVGVITPTSRPSWRAIPAITPTHLLAAGHLIAVVQAEYSGSQGHDPRLPARVAYSTDDGQHWSSTTPPVGSVDRVELDLQGVLTLREALFGPAEPDSGCGPPVIGHKSYAAKLDAPHWVAARLPAWTYDVDHEHTCDHFSRSYVVAVHGNRREDISGRHLIDADGSTWAMGTYGMWGGSLYRLDKATATKLAEVPFEFLNPIAVDGSGSLLAMSSNERLVRWSSAGGWRGLFPAP